MLYHCYTGLEGYVLGGLKLKTQQKTHAAIQWFKFLSYPFTISHSVCACVCVSLCFFNWGLPFPVLFVVDVAWFTTTWRTVRLSVNLIEASLIPALLKLHWKTTDSSYFLVILCHHMQSYAIIQYESNSIKHEIVCWFGRIFLWCAGHRRSFGQRWWRSAQHCSRTQMSGTVLTEICRPHHT